MSYVGDHLPQPHSDRGGEPPRRTTVGAPAAPEDPFDQMLAFVDTLTGPQLRSLVTAVNVRYARLRRDSTPLWDPGQGDSEARP